MDGRRSRNRIRRIAGAGLHRPRLAVVIGKAHLAAQQKVDVGVERLARQQLRVARRFQQLAVAGERRELRIAPLGEVGMGAQQTAQ